MIGKARPEFPSIFSQPNQGITPRHTRHDVGVHLRDNELGKCTNTLQVRTQSSAYTRMLDQICPSHRAYTRCSPTVVLKGSGKCRVRIIQPAHDIYRVLAYYEKEVQ